MSGANSHRISKRGQADSPSRRLLRGRYRRLQSSKVVQTCRPQERAYLLIAVAGLESYHATAEAGGSLEGSLR